MPTNRAAAELQNLLDMQGDAQSAEDNLAKLQEARTQFNPNADQEADFAWPEGAATAVAAGWILGPVGGLLMGLAQGLYTKRQEQAALDQYVNTGSTLGAAADIFHSELDRLALTTENPGDLEQLSAMQTEFDTAMQFMSSASPELQQQGSQLLASAHEKLNGYTVRQEEQAIAAKAYDDQLRRDLDEQQYSRFNELHDEFRAESQGFEDVMLATDQALNALQNGTPSELWAAGILINKTLDPTGVVRQEEAEAVGAIGSLWDKANTLMEKARSGQTMLPEQRQELMGLLYSMRETNTQFQLARESRYANTIGDLELPQQYHDNFRLASNVPAAISSAEPLKNVATLPASDIEQAASDAIFPYTDQGIALNAKYAWGNFKNWARDTFTSDKTEEERQADLAETMRKIPK